jgi:hypothetical protein
MVPKGTQIRTSAGDIDFHKTLSSAISAHKSAHQAIVRRVVKRNKAIKSTLPALKETAARVAGVSQTLKGGRKVYDISEATGSAVTGSAGRRLTEIAGIGGAKADETGNIPEESRASVIEYNLNKAPEMGERESSQTEKEIQAYAKKKTRSEMFQGGIVSGTGVGLANPGR